MPEGLDHHGAPSWATLGGSLRGRIVLPGDEGVERIAKHLAAGTLPPNPQALIACADLNDLRRSLDFLRSCNMRFAVRSGGNCFADLSSSPNVVLDLSDLKSVEVDAERVRVQPGTTSAELARELARHGRCVALGGSGNVALGGLSVTGGCGVLGRRDGFTIDQVEQYQVLTADGRLLVADETRHPGLFWALRGAGAAGFGIVTEITLRTQPLIELTAVHGQWPLDVAADLIERWQHWLMDQPAEIVLGLSLISPDDPQQPCQIELIGALLGTAAEVQHHSAALARWLGPLSVGLDSWPLSGTQAAEYLGGCLDARTQPAWEPCRPLQTGYQFTRTQFFEQGLSRDVIRACLEQLAMDRRFPQCRELEFVPLGSAYAIANTAACFLHRSPQMLVRHTAIVGARSTPESRQHSRRWVDSSHATLAAQSNGHAYQAYADPRLQDWAEAYYGSTYERLQQIKQLYDPDQVFRHAQSIIPRIVSPA